MTASIEVETYFASSAKGEIAKLLVSQSMRSA
jgi:hypothetical protein